VSQDAALLQDFLAIGRAGFGGGGWRGRPEIGDQVAQAHIRLVTDRGNNRHRHRGNRASDALTVECPEIFDRAAAARHDQHVDRQP